MKTNSAARRVWNLRIGIACLVIAALASFNLWAVGYCSRNLAMTSTQEASTQQVWHGSMAGSELFSGVR